MAKKKLKKGLWSKNEVQILKKDFPQKSCAEVAKRLGRPLYAVKRKAYRLGIFKTKKYLKSIGRA
jgi:hypothetical protein